MPFHDEYLRLVFYADAILFVLYIALDAMFPHSMISFKLGLFSAVRSLIWTTMNSGDLTRFLLCFCYSYLSFVSAVHYKNYLLLSLFNMLMFKYLFHT